MLTIGQSEQLLAMTRAHEPAIKISRWLMQMCGLGFREASLERAKALIRCGYDSIEYQRLSQANLNVMKMEEEAEKKAMANEKRKATIMSKKLMEPTEAPPPPVRASNDALCVTCGQENFNCACAVKRVTDIPF